MNPKYQQKILGWSLRYGLAVVAVIAGFVLRKALTAWAGPGLATYITFYPAVMVAALIAGFGPGMLATLLVELATAYWILPPEGQFQIASLVDRLGLVIFAGMGLLMSAVAEVYRRNRNRAAAYEREQVLRESQQVLQKQVELIDPVRAEIIAHEMLRIVRERGAPRAAPLEPTVALLRRGPLGAGVLLALIGAMALLGWLLRVPELKSVVPGLATMKANTAVCFLLAGTALALRDRRGVRLACAGIVCAVAGLSLAEYLMGWNLGLDQLIFHDTPDTHTLYPGRMASATALSFFMSGTALLLLNARRTRWMQQVLALGSGLIGLVALLGYAYDVQTLYRFAGYSSMALNTAAGMVVLAAGLLLARTDGVARMLMDPGPGSQLARRFLPMAILLPLVIGWLHEVGERNGIWNPPVGAGLFALAMMLSLLTTVWTIARALNRADTARSESEAQLRHQSELMDHANEALIVRELGGAIRFWNRGAAALYGWPATEVLGQRTHTLLRTEGAQVEEKDAQLARTGHWEGELIHTARDGRRIVVESRQTATHRADGRLLILESNRDITERKLAEEALLKSQQENEFLANLLEQASQPFAVGYPDGRMGRVNPAFEHLTGYSAAELHALDWSAVLTPPEWREIERDQLDELHRTGQPVRYEKEYIRKDGSRVPIELLVHLMQDADGKPQYYYSFLTDITERKRVEAEIQRLYSELEQRVRDRTAQLEQANRALQTSHSLLNETQRLSKVGGWEFDVATGRVSWTEEVYRIHGVTKDYNPSIPEQDIQFYAPEDQQRMAAAFQRCAAQGEPYDLELQLVTAQGNRIWVRTRGQPESENGKIVRLSGNIMDITEIRKAQAALQDANARLEARVAERTAELRQGEERLRFALETCHIGAWDLDLEDHTAFRSLEHDRIFGYTELLPQWTYEMFLDHVLPEDRTAVDGKFRGAMERHSDWNFECRIRQPNGQVRWIWAAGRHGPDTAGAPRRMAGIVQDITERKQAEEEIRRLNVGLELRVRERTAQLEAVNKELEAFSYSVSHDLRAPLRAVIGFVHKLQKDHTDQLDPEGHRLLGVVTGEAQRMGRLIDDLLAFSRMGRQQVDRASIDMAALARTEFERLTKAAPETAPRLDLKPLPPAQGDPAMLQQVFANLIGNAVKFTRRQPAPVIEIGGESHEGATTYYVKDNGVGFDDKYGHKLFGVFQRLHSSDEFEGNGVGLALVQRIVQRHGGQVRAEGKPGAGATFYFTLPHRKESNI